VQDDRRVQAGQPPVHVVAVPRGQRGRVTAEVIAGAKTDESDLRALALGDVGAGVQRDRVPHDVSALVGHPALDGEPARHVGSVQLEPQGSGAPPAEPEVVQHGAEEEQLVVVVTARFDALPATGAGSTLRIVVR
jgi:hypothetical protein